MADLFHDNVPFSFIDSVFLTTVPNESIMKKIGRRSDIFYDVTKTLVSREQANLRLEEPNNLDQIWDLQNKEWHSNHYATAFKFMQKDRLSETSDREERSKSDIMRIRVYSGKTSSTL